MLNPAAALRVNLLHTAEDVPDRSPASRDRQGAALSLKVMPSDALSITADYYHLDAEDQPDLGTYIVNNGDGSYGEPLDDIPVYLQDEDFLASQIDTYTLRLDYVLTPRSRLVNLSRYGTTDNGYLATGARGSSGYTSLADAETGTNGYDTAVLSTHQGWQEVEYFANQLNWLTRLRLGATRHAFIVGAEYTDHQVINGVYDQQARGAGNCFSRGRGGAGEGYCLFQPDGNVTPGVNRLLARDLSRGDWDSDWQIETLSLYLMDTVDLSTDWTLFGGIRYDDFDYRNLVSRGGQVTAYEYSDGLWNGHLGLQYRFRPGANLYASYGTASNINGGESDLGSSCGYGGICTTDGLTDLGTPETTKSLELGTKWKLMGDRLLATAAVFRLTKDDVMESDSNDSYANSGTLNTGRNRVEGVEFGLSGNLTEQLSVQAGITVMNAEVLASNNPENVGRTLANFADKSYSLQLRYQATPALALGAAATYESERFTGQPDTAANEAMAIPDYTVVDAFASYRVNRNLDLRLNVGNLFDEDYYLAAYRSGAFTYIGDARNARLTLNYRF